MVGDRDCNGEPLDRRLRWIEAIFDDNEGSPFSQDSGRIVFLVDNGECGGIRTESLARIFFEHTADENAIHVKDPLRVSAPWSDGTRQFSITLTSVHVTALAVFRR